MINIKLIRENPDLVKSKIKNKNIEIDINQLLDLDKNLRLLKQDIEKINAEQNKISAEIQKEQDPEEKQNKIKNSQELKVKIADKEIDLKKLSAEYDALMYKIPNLPNDNVPIGKDSNDNVVLKKVGEKPKFDFTPKDYLTLSENLDYIDVKRASKVSGSRFGYFKNKVALLEIALINFVLATVISKENIEKIIKDNNLDIASNPFIPIIPPVMIKEEMMKGMGYIDKPSDQEESYFFDKDKLYLVGTSEQSIGPMFADEVLKESELPKRFISFSTCFRREAGSYGKDTKGILRVHQFDKLEMFSFCHPEKSQEEHKLILAIEEKLMQMLEIPYQVLQLCSGDLGWASSITYDIESWMPGQNQGNGEYRETHSCSNIGDFQSRRLNIRYQPTDKSQKTELIHTLNGTAFAIGRIIIAILENYQQKDGSIKTPEILKKYIVS